MKTLDRLENGVATLLVRYRELQNINAELVREKKLWQQERQELLSEVGSVLERLAAIHLEES
jgi:hypothetical protein